MYTGSRKYSAAEMESMRCTSMTEILRDFGFDPRHTASGLYFSPFHEERTPSFHIDEHQHKWFDHGNRIPGQKSGGDVFDLVMAIKSCSFPEACDYLIRFNPNLSVRHDDDIIDISGRGHSSSLTRRTIDRVLNGIKASSLKNYALTERHIPLPILNRYCREVHYTNHYSNGTSSSPYAIGFPNIDGSVLASSSDFDYSYWYARHASESSVIFTDGLSDANVEYGEDKAYTTLHSFYSFPNDMGNFSIGGNKGDAVVNDGTDKKSNSYLIVEAAINGKLYAYPIILPKTEANKKYNVTLQIAHLGQDPSTPWDLVDFTDFQPKITVEAWDSKSYTEKI